MSYGCILPGVHRHQQQQQQPLVSGDCVHILCTNCECCINENDHLCVFLTQVLCLNSPQRTNGQHREKKNVCLQLETSHQMFTNSETISRKANDLQTIQTGKSLRMQHREFFACSLFKS